MVNSVTLEGSKFVTPIIPILKGGRSTIIYGSKTLSPDFLSNKLADKNGIDVPSETVFKNS